MPPLIKTWLKKRYNRRRNKSSNRKKSNPRTTKTSRTENKATTIKTNQKTVSRRIQNKMASRAIKIPTKIRVALRIKSRNLALIQTQIQSLTISRNKTKKTAKKNQTVSPKKKTRLARVKITNKHPAMKNLKVPPGPNPLLPIKCPKSNARLLSNGCAVYPTTPAA